MNLSWPKNFSAISMRLCDCITPNICSYCIEYLQFNETGIFAEIYIGVHDMPHGPDNLEKKTLM